MRAHRFPSAFGTLASITENSQTPTFANKAFKGQKHDITTPVCWENAVFVKLNYVLCLYSIVVFYRYSEYTQKSFKQVLKVTFKVM